MERDIFRIEESWQAGIWKPAVPAALALAGAYLLVLSPYLQPVPLVILCVALGAVSVWALLYRQKQRHLERHLAEAKLLGFRYAIKGSRRNPFAAAEIVLNPPAGSGEENALLADLVRMHGPDYAMLGQKTSYGGNLALLTGCAILLSAHGAHQGPGRLFGVAALILLLSEAEAYFARYEARRTGPESRAFHAPGADYLDWNFLSLEAKRIAADRIPAMEKAIGRILLKEAGLKPGAKILEAGAGGGFLWRHAPKELRADWTQVEKNPQAVIYADLHGNGSLFCRSDIKALPLPDASFDAIIGLECFDALSSDSLAAFLIEARRLLKPGGRLVHLKDFPDWPGAVLVSKFRRITMQAIGKELVKVNGKLRFSYKNLGQVEISALSKAADSCQPLDRPYAKTLAAMYGRGIKSDPRYRVPMLVSLMALKEFVAEAGFEIASDSLTNAETGAVAFLIARKP